jgi:hypothetical protein
MALETNSGSVQLESKSIGLFTLRTSNQYKPSWVPEVGSIEVIRQESDKSVKFQATKPHSKEKDNFFEYLISVDLPPGIYRVGCVYGCSRKFPVVGTFNFPIGASFELPPNSVVYLGHVNMVNRKRNDGERRSGPILPGDQLISGYANSTFDISISDRSDTDILLFEQAYPKLKEHMIVKNVMRK